MIYHLECFTSNFEESTVYQQQEYGKYKFENMHLYIQVCSGNEHNSNLIVYFF